VADLPGGAKLGEGLDDYREILALAPVQQVEVDAVGLEAAKTLLARSDDLLAARGVGRQNLRDDEDPVSPSRDRLGNQAFGRAVSIHLGGVDQGKSEVDAETQRGELGLPFPGPLA
jgi:hypothetical protein